MRSAPAKGGADPLVVVGAITAGVLLFLIARSSNAQTATPLPVVGGSSPGTPALSPLDARLQSSEQAREIYLFQAELYMYGYTTAPPDGIFGPVTQGLMQQVDTTIGFTQTSATWLPSYVAYGREAIETTNQTQNGTYQLPASSVPLPNPPSAASLALLEQTSQTVDPNTTMHWT
jgi:hypothetical protein